MSIIHNKHFGDLDLEYLQFQGQMGFPVSVNYQKISGISYS